MGGRNTRRNPDDPSRLPAKSAIVALIENASDFLDFQVQNENYTGALHVWIGGDMNSVGFAAYDPIYWIRVASTDRLWHLWQTRHPTAKLPESIMNQSLPPYKLKVSEVVDVHRLGYSYEC